MLFRAVQKRIQWSIPLAVTVAYFIPKTTERSPNGNPESNVRFLSWVTLETQILLPARLGCSDFVAFGASECLSPRFQRPGNSKYFDPLSAPAETLYQISLLVLVVCASIFFVVAGLLTYAIIRYPKHDVVTANEIHVPLSSRTNRVPTRMVLESADVIHGFWVPQLNGKTMLVPNYKNTMWIEPYATGVYLGNCTVLCGQQHANMLIRVVVDSPDVFQKWLESQKRTPLPEPQVAEGQKQFIASSCGTCHRIEDTPATGG